MQKSAMEPCALIFDLETSPDPAWCEEPLAHIHNDKPSNGGTSRSFAPPAFHQIVCIAAVRVRRHDGAWITDAVGASSIAEHSERDLVRNFVAAVDRDDAKLVGFNSTKFDLSVIRYRAMRHQIAAPCLTKRSIFYRFGDSHLDLCDILSAFDPRERLSLDRTCRALGLPGKTEGVDGGSVAELLESNEHRRLADYAIRDVIITTMLFFRYELFCGRISPSAHDRSVNSLLAFLRLRPDRFSDAITSGLEPQRES